jgi:uncharacterized protein DUF3291
VTHIPDSHLAQINIARMLAPIDDPLMAEFAAQLVPVNALADEAPGFVWRLQTESGNATGIKVYDDDRIIVNLTVWETAFYVTGSAGSRNSTVPITQCGGYPPDNCQVLNKASNGWSICGNMAIRTMRFRSNIYFPCRPAHDGCRAGSADDHLPQRPQSSQRKTRNSLSD